MKKSEKSPFLCRTCLHRIKGAMFYPQDSKGGMSKTIKEVLRECYPDLDLDITENFVLCYVCTRKLRLVYQYFEDCMKAEYRITESIKNCKMSLRPNWIEFSSVLNTDGNNSTSPTCSNLQFQVVDNQTTVVDMLKQTSSVCGTSQTVTSKIRNFFYSSPLNGAVIEHTTDDDDVVFTGSSDIYNTCQYFCDVCKNSYTTSNHDCPSKNITTKYFKCTACNITFTNQSDLHSHLQLDKLFAAKNSQGFYVKCYKCTSQFKTRKELNAHFVESHTATFSCDQCSTYFTKSYDKHKAHIQEHLKTQATYKCIVCCSLFDSQTLLDEHNMCTHLLTCYKCAERFDSLENVMAHTAICIGKSLDLSNDLEHNTYVCSTCKFICKTELDLDIHMLSLHTDTIIKCQQCSKLFSTVDALFLHVQNCNKTENALAFRPDTQLENESEQLEWINYDEQPVLIL